MDNSSPQRTRTMTNGLMITVQRARILWVHGGLKPVTLQTSMDFTILVALNGSTGQGDMPTSNLLK